MIYTFRTISMLIVFTRRGSPVNDVMGMSVVLHAELHVNVLLTNIWFDGISILEGLAMKTFLRPFS